MAMRFRGVSVSADCLQEVDVVTVKFSLTEFMTLEEKKKEKRVELNGCTTVSAFTGRVCFCANCANFVFILPETTKATNIKIVEQEEIRDSERKCRKTHI